MRRYETYKDSGVEWIGEIPEGWEMLQGKYCFEMHDDIVGERFSDYPLLTLSKQGVRKRDLEAGGKFPASFESYKAVEPNWLVLCLFDMDETPCTVGLSREHGMITGAYDLFSAKRIIDIRYAYYLYYAADMQKSLKPWYTGLRKTISPNTFLHIKLPVPPLPEQQAIADYLDAKTAEIDSIVSQTERSIGLLREYRKSVISEAVTKGLDPNAPMKDSGVEWIGEIPEGWEVRAVRYIGSCSNGLSKAGEFFGSGHPFISYGNVYRDELDRPELYGLVQSTEKEREACSLHRGDVLFTRTSENIEEVAISATVLEDIENATFAGFLIRLRPFDECSLIPEFSRYYFKAEKHREYFNKEMMLVTRASLSQDLLKGLAVLIPPLPEQQAIADYLDAKTAEIDSLIADKQRQVELLREYRKSLISEAVTGKFKVPGLE